MYLRSDLYFCEIDDKLLVLDLAADRYFCLEGGLRNDFLEIAAGNINHPVPSRLLDMGLVHAQAGPSVRRIMPVPLLATEEMARERRSSDWRHVCELAVDRLWLRRTFRRQSFGNALISAIRIPRSGVRDGPMAACEAGAGIAAAFHRLALFVSVSDQCVLNSVAVLRFLRRRGVPCKLIFGVKLGPFAAHCWPQMGKRLIIDRLDYVSRFTPIMIL